MLGLELLAFTRPALDWHALAPEIVILVVGALLTLVDIIWDEKVRRLMPSLAGIGLLAALVPVLTLALDGTERSMFGGGYVVDDFSLVLKALFLIVGYVIVLISTDYVRDGDYYENEYYQLLLASIMGMIMISSSRDLISIFIALELLSIPAYMLAAWRKGDEKGNEAGMKYYLMGVFASAIMLYGMSLLFGLSGGSTVLSDIAASDAFTGDESVAMVTIAVLFTLIGFLFKVSAVPFHTWAPDTYEGAPTPITAYLAVGSKAAGFVGLITFVVAFQGRADVFEPLFWILAALTMTVGNLIALRQTNIVRLLAYSGIAQGGFMLAPLAVAGSSDIAIQAIVTYLGMYAVSNLAAFAVVLLVARKTRTGDISSYDGLFSYAPALSMSMTIALMSLAGMPPLALWFGKLMVFQALLGVGDTAAVVLAVIVGVNSVIAFAYYAKITGRMWFKEAPNGDLSPVPITPSLAIATGLMLTAILAFGIYPDWMARFGEMAQSLAL